MSRFRGGGSWARPENALKRAEELIGVGQKAAALQSLRDVITSKRSRANWSKTYEDIMFKLMDLCVEMKRRNDAKEALMQYRNMCQQVNINSLEEVIKYYLNKATEKAEEARAHAEVGAAQWPNRAQLPDLDRCARACERARSGALCCLVVVCRSPLLLLRVVAWGGCGELRVPRGGPLHQRASLPNAAHQRLRAPC